MNGQVANAIQGGHQKEDFSSDKFHHSPAWDKIGLEVALW